MECHPFCFYATVHLNSDDAAINKRTIERAKRLIKKDNPEELIFYFISRNSDEDGVFRAYISFYSFKRLVGTRLLAEESKANSEFSIAGQQSYKRIKISKNIEVRYQGIIKKIKEGKVYDLSFVSLPDRFKRFGFLNQIKSKLTLN